jgi:hypothetical protein
MQDRKRLQPARRIRVTSYLPPYSVPLSGSSALDRKQAGGHGCCGLAAGAEEAIKLSMAAKRNDGLLGGPLGARQRDEGPRAGRKGTIRQCRPAKCEAYCTAPPYKLRHGHRKDRRTPYA